MGSKFIAIGIAAAALGIIASYAMAEWGAPIVATADLIDNDLFTVNIAKDSEDVSKQQNAESGRFVVLNSPGEKNIPEQEKNSESVEEISFCAFYGNKEKISSDIILNEIAWMGSPNAGGSDAEWIELYNTSNQDLYLDGWQLIDEKGQIQVSFTEQDRIAAYGFYLLERRSEDAVRTITADYIYNGALANENEGLRLFADECVLVDEVLADPKWPAGNNVEKRTMERVVNSKAWQTSYVIGGTPKAMNSLPSPPIVEDIEEETPPPIAESDPNSATSNVNHIVISEFQTSGGVGHTTDDFIEIYNPLDTPFNLKGHRLVKRSETATKDTLIKSWTSDTFIPARGFYLWANSGYVEIGVAPDVTTSGSIADNNGIAIREGANDVGVIIDSVAWGSAANEFGEGDLLSNAEPNESFERKAWVTTCIDPSGLSGNGCDTENNANDFVVMVNVNPQNTSSPSEP